MRKNGVNRKLQEIQGGVCAPKGFKANGIHCGISRDLNKKDLSIIVADRRCPTAAVFSENSTQSAPVQLCKKHLKNGLARAILINSEIANVFLPNGEFLAEKLCRILALHSDVDINDVLIASTGRVGEPLPLTPFENGMQTLVKGLTATEQGSLFAAEGIMATDKSVKQLAFEFSLGDFPCKIGVIFKGSTHVCPNMATTLAFFTTDVNISSEMLQKALSVTVRDTFNMISVDGVSSPNDTVCIMANGNAGNYKISSEDTEYAKFVYVLREAMKEVCKRIVGDESQKMLTCNVQGAKSKQVARALARELVCARFEIESLLFKINSVTEEVDFSKLRIAFSAEGNTYFVYDEGRTLPLSEERRTILNQSKKLILTIDLGVGNYISTAYGRLS